MGIENLDSIKKMHSVFCKTDGVEVKPTVTWKGRKYEHAEIGMFTLNNATHQLQTVTKGLAPNPNLNQMVHAILQKIIKMDQDGKALLKGKNCFVRLAVRIRQILGNFFTDRQRILLKLERNFKVDSLAPKDTQLPVNTLNAQVNTKSQVPPKPADAPKTIQEKASQVPVAPSNNEKQVPAPKTTIQETPSRQKITSVDDLKINKSLKKSNSTIESLNLFSKDEVNILGMTRDDLDQLKKLKKERDAKVNQEKNVAPAPEIQTPPNSLIEKPEEKKEPESEKQVAAEEIKTSPNEIKITEQATTPENEINKNEPEVVKEASKNEKPVETAKKAPLNQKKIISINDSLSREKGPKPEQKRLDFLNLFDHKGEKTNNTPTQGLVKEKKQSSQKNASPENLTNQKAQPSPIEIEKPSVNVSPLPNSSNASSKSNSFNLKDGLGDLLLANLNNYAPVEAPIEITVNPMTTTDQTQNLDPNVKGLLQDFEKSAVFLEFPVTTPDVVSIEKPLSNQENLNPLDDNLKMILEHMDEAYAKLNKDILKSEMENMIKMAKDHKDTLTHKQGEKIKLFVEKNQNEFYELIANRHEAKDIQDHLVNAEAYGKLISTALLFKDYKVKPYKQFFEHVDEEQAFGIAISMSGINKDLSEFFKNDYEWENEDLKNTFIRMLPPNPQ